MTTMLGTLAGMMPIPCPSSEVFDEDMAVTVVSTGAGAYAMRPPHRGLRVWRVETSVATPPEQAALRGLLRYSSGPLIYVSEVASGVNGLSPAQSALQASTLPTGVSVGGSELVADPSGEFRVAWTAGTTLDTEWVLDASGPPCPVIPGGPVTIAAGLRRKVALPAVLARMGVEWISANGLVLSRDMADVASSTVQPLTRATRTLTAPTAARAARLVFHRATQVAAPSITLTDTLRPYGEGDGAPEVVTMSIQSSPYMVTAGATFGSQDLIVQEVGLAVR